MRDRIGNLLRPKRIMLIIILILFIYKPNGQYISLNSLFALKHQTLYYIPLFAYAMIGWVVYSLATKWRPAVISTKRLLFSPAMFLVMTTPALIGGKYHDTSLIAYAIGIIAAFVLSMLWHKKLDIQADHKRGLIAIPADPFIIVATLLVLINGLSSGYLNGIHLDLLKSWWLLPLMACVSSAIAGHRIAKSLSLYLKFRSAPHTDLVKSK